jgi:hypothetical protein
VTATPGPPRKPPEHDPAAAAPVAAPSGASARPDGPQRPQRRDSEAARRDRAERDAIARYGGEVLDDEVPFG